MFQQQLDPLRVIEINFLGKFYVIGNKPYTVLELPNVDPKLAGFIIVEESFKEKFYGASRIPISPQSNNVVLKLNTANKPTMLVFIKDRQMAEDICFACNRIRA
jgi:hypothetical protein